MESVVSRDGTRIAYQVLGAGAPLVLVHGISSDHTAWTALLPQLTARFRVYAVDRRGRGGSGDHDRYSIEQEADDLVTVIEAINEPVFLLGHSFGGLCALEAALRTQRLGKLILYEPSVPAVYAYWPEKLRHSMQSFLAAGEPEKALELFYLDIVRVPPHQIEQMRLLPTWKSKLAIVHTIQRELEALGTFALDPKRYAHIQVPTLLLRGGSSPPHREEAIALLSSLLPHAQVVVLEGQGHFAHQTAPGTFSRIITDFLIGQTA